MLIDTIAIKLTADASSVTQGLHQGLDSVEKFSKKMSELGNKLGQVGLGLSAFGAVMTREAAKYDANVKRAVDNLSGAYSAMAVRVGQALTPTVNELASGLSRLVSAWDAMDPKTKQSIVDYGLLAAKILAVVAVGAKVAGIIATLSGIGAALSPAIIPILGIAAALTAVVVALEEIDKVKAGNLSAIGEFVTDKTAGQIQLLEQTRARLLDKRGEKVALARAVEARGAPENNVFRTQANELTAEIARYTQEISRLSGKLSSVEAPSIDEAVGNRIKKIVDSIMGAAGIKLPGSGRPASPGAAHDLRAPEKNKQLMGAFADIQAGLTPEAYPEWQERPFRRIGGGSRIASSTTARGPQGAMQQMEQAEAAWEKSAEYLKGLGQNLLAKFGDAGETINAALQGFQTGGPWGAVLGVLLSLLTKTAQFQTIVTQVSDGFGMLAEALGPILEVVVQVNRLTNEFIRIALEVLKPVFEALKGFGSEMSNLVNTLIGWWNEAMSFIGTQLANIAATLGDNIFGQAVAAVSKAFFSMRMQIQAATHAATPPVASAAPPAGEAATSWTQKNAAANERAAAAIKDVTEALTNVPQGFKVAAARFGATESNVDISSGLILPGGGHNGDGSVNVIIQGNVIGIEDFEAEIARARQRRGFQQTGARSLP